MIKGVVFDLDGTLLDSQLCFTSIRQALGIPEGQLILEYLETLDHDERSEKTQALEEIELHAAMKSKLFPGAQEVLTSLPRIGVKAGILTRNCKRVVSWFLGAFPELAVEYAVARELAPPKPNPRGLQIFLDRWSIAPSELLMVGDSYLDMECGLNAGVKTAWFRQDSNHITTNVHFIIDHLSELLGIVAGKT